MLGSPLESAESRRTRQIVREEIRSALADNPRQPMGFPAALLSIFMLLAWASGCAAGWVYSWWLALACFFLPPVAWIVSAAWIMDFLAR